MLKIFIPIFLCSLLLLEGCKACSDAVFKGACRTGHYSKHCFTERGLTKTQILEKANDNFAFRGKPIHPGLVQEFECWLSDLNPITVTVDVSAAYDSNEYSEEPFMRGQYLAISTPEENGEYGYVRVTTTRKGIHILKTKFYGGGSGTFGSELWVKFEIGKGFYPDGTPYDQLLMRLVRAK